MLLVVVAELVIVAVGVLDDETDCVDVLVPDMVFVENGLPVLVLLDVTEAVLDGVAVDVREFVVVAVEVRLDVIVAVDVIVGSEDLVDNGDTELVAELVVVRVLVILRVAVGEAVLVRVADTD